MAPWKASPCSAVSWADSCPASWHGSPRAGRTAQAGRPGYRPGTHTGATARPEPDTEISANQPMTTGARPRSLPSRKRNSTRMAPRSGRAQTERARREAHQAGVRLVRLHFRGVREHGRQLRRRLQGLARQLPSTSPVNYATTSALVMRRHKAGVCKDLAGSYLVDLRARMRTRSAAPGHKRPDRGTSPGHHRHRQVGVGSAGLQCSRAADHRWIAAGHFGVGGRRHWRPGHISSKPTVPEWSS
jgi:hypothetical protein